MLRLVSFFIALILCVPVLRAQPVNIRINEPSLRDPEEVSIALNPKNLNQLVVGANISYLFTSSNAGATWDMTHINQPLGVWGDPCLMFDDSGILYYEHLSGFGWPPIDTQFLWRIVVQRSSDAGRTFDDGAEIGFDPPTQQDKAWLALDRSGTASKGTVYTSWTEFDKYASTLPLDSSRMYFSLSTDHGLNWSDRVRVDDTGGDCLDSSNTVEGITTAASPDGSINIAWEARQHIYFDRSTDGGKTFGKDRIIAEQPGGWDFNVPGISRTDGFAMLASDLNPKSLYYGWLYLMWSDQRGGPTNVYFISSTDQGTSWTAPLRVSPQGKQGAHNFFPSMALDPISGRLYIVYYSLFTDNRVTSVMLARSTDGGQSFTNELLSESVFTPVDTVFFGDYIHIVAYDKHVYPVWMRMDGSLLSVWTAHIMDTASVAGVASGVQDTVNRLWVTGDAIRPSVAFALTDHEQVSIELFDMLGRHVESLLSGDYGKGEYRIMMPAAATSGEYIVRMTTIALTTTPPHGFSTLVAKVIVP